MTTWCQGCDRLRPVELMAFTEVGLYWCVECRDLIGDAPDARTVRRFRKALLIRAGCLAAAVVGAAGFSALDYEVEEALTPATVVTGISPVVAAVCFSKSRITLRKTEEEMREANERRWPPVPAGIDPKILDDVKRNPYAVLLPEHVELRAQDGQNMFVLQTCCDCVR